MGKKINFQVSDIQIQLKAQYGVMNAKMFIFWIADLASVWGSQLVFAQKQEKGFIHRSRKVLVVY